RESEVAVESRVVGPQRQGAFEVVDRRPRVSPIAEHGAELVVAEHARRIRVERRTPERLRVAPDLDLEPGEAGEADDPHGDAAGHDRGERPPEAPRRRGVERRAAGRTE